jgi:hypothetical protein
VCQVAWQQVSYRFSDLKVLMAKTMSPRSGGIVGAGFQCPACRDVRPRRRQRFSVGDREEC